MKDDTQKQQTEGSTGTSSKARSATVIRTNEPKPTSPIPKEGSVSDGRSVKKVSGRRSASAPESAAQSAEINVSNKRTLAPRKKVGKRVALSDPEVETTRPTQEEENSIEETVTRFLDNSTTQAYSGPAVFADRSDVSAYLLSNIGRVTRDVGAWLLNWKKPASPRVLEVATAAAKGNVDTNPPAARAATDAIVNPVPEAVSRRFLKVGQDYYFLDKTLAFSDRGTKLATRGADPDVVRSLVDIATARGWGSVTLKGTKEFRRSAWIEAAHRGLKVVGYEPNPLDIAELANRPVSNSVEKSLTKEIVMPTSLGPRPAVQANLDTPPITVQTPSSGVPSAPQAVVKDPELIKKAKAFEMNKPAYVVKKYPDLVGAYGIVEAAKTFAIERLPESVREEFVGIARQHILQKIAAGDVVKGPKVYANHSKVVTSDVPRKTSDKGGAEKTKEQPLKEVVRAR